MLLALCITLCAGVWASARSAALSGSLVRLHVVAVSDDAEEQAVFKPLFPIALTEAREFMQCHASSPFRK